MEEEAKALEKADLERELECITAELESQVALTKSATEKLETQRWVPVLFSSPLYYYSHHHFIIITTIMVIIIIMVIIMVIIIMVIVDMTCL
jgi:hypothetical protein